MTENELIDRLIDDLHSHDYLRAIDELLDIGEPALHRLIQVVDGTVTIPLRSKDELENRQEALIKLGRLHKGTFLRLIDEDPKRLNVVSIVWVLGFIDDDRVTDILISILQRDNTFLGFAAYKGLQRRGDKRALEALARSERPLVHLLPPRQSRPSSNLGAAKEDVP